MATTNGLTNGDMPDRSSGKAVNGEIAEMDGYPSRYAAKHNLAPHFLGGNSLQNASPSRVRDFVQAHDGHTVIKNVCRPLRAPAAGL